MVMICFALPCFVYVYEERKINLSWRKQVPTKSTKPFVPTDRLLRMHVRLIRVPFVAHHLRVIRLAVLSRHGPAYHLRWHTAMWSLGSSRLLIRRPRHRASRIVLPGVTLLSLLRHAHLLLLVILIRAVLLLAVLFTGIWRI